MKSRVLLFVAVVAATAGLASAESVTVIDMTGRAVSLSQPVERIECVYGMGTFYVYALGAGDRLVAAWYPGVKSVSGAPVALQIVEPRLASLVHAGDPNLEEMAALEPDLVIGDASRFATFAEQMGAIGVPVLLFAPETPQGVVDTALALGAALGAEAAVRAARLTADFWRVYAAARATTAAMPQEARPRVLFLGSSPLQVASGAMYQTSMIAAAGGVSVSEGLAGSWITANLEQILAWNPDAIVLASYANFSAADLAANPDWQSLRAVQTGRVAKMPRVLAPMDTPLPESLLGVMWLSSLLYPEQATFDVRAEAIAFYETYYDYTLQASEADGFLAP